MGKTIQKRYLRDGAAESRALGFLLHLLQLVENLLYMSGIIGILAGQTRLTRHIDAPFC